MPKLLLVVKAADRASNLVAPLQCELHDEGRDVAGGAGDANRFDRSRMCSGGVHRHSASLQKAEGAPRLGSATLPLPALLAGANFGHWARRAGPSSEELPGKLRTCMILFADELGCLPSPARFW
eukprot:scaffold570_cov234-Pinguiococcus_pyrenoidosus.AAC.8